ncbi:uncharacterized protein FIBRA_03854 [Fibroporia radiculosa]|uniref:Cytochrome P450 n=1 Tax=Fibroporia radiculosa TaxID=599839 RepID=J4HW78_9APHY|nr:uncharacterized protein FIBRA_03854 [Fibroporia radiculosa]CCM01787.1 predicted protein [Fibroporia radiculosa]
MSPPGLFNPWNPGLMWHWKKRLFGLFEVYERFGMDTVSVVPYAYGNPMIYTANFEIFRQVLAGGVKTPWIKHPGTTFQEWGVNVHTAKKEEWKRHRRITGAAFNNNLYTHIWEQTVQAYYDWTRDEGWSATEFASIPVIQTVTSKLTFLIIVVCGFGLNTSWSDEAHTDTGNMTIPEAMRILSLPSPFKYLPKPMMQLPFKALREFRSVRQVVDKYMRERVNERQAYVRTQVAMNEEGDRDMFSLLVRANGNDVMNGSKQTLSDSELMSNVFLMLFAGYESTAHTLAATFALLAVHPEVQDDIYSQILDVVGLDRDPTANDYHNLNKALYAYFEGTRMFPTVVAIFREAGEDIPLPIPVSLTSEEKTTLVVPKGTIVALDVLGYHYNPHYFPDPTKFIPSRWEGDAKGDTLAAFGHGPRICLGRRFSTTEAVAFLTMCLRDWVVEPLLQEGETIDQWRSRVLDGRFFLVLGVKNVPVRLRRRRAV